MLLLELYTQLYLGSQIENSSINYINHDFNFEYQNLEISSPSGFTSEGEAKKD
jgi:hypothetical protein